MIRTLSISGRSYYAFKWEKIESKNVIKKQIINPVIRKDNLPNFEANDI